MKKLFFILLFALTSSCSSDNVIIQKEIPEQFHIRIEIKGISSSPAITLFTTGRFSEEWRDEYLNFDKEHIYHVPELIVSRVNALKYITISVSAYLSDSNKMEVFNLYVDGVLVDSTTTINPPSGGLLKSTTLRFKYYL